MDMLFDMSDFESVLSEFNEQADERNEDFLNAGMSDEMKASQKRYEDYIKKHGN